MRTQSNYLLLLLALCLLAIPANAQNTKQVNVKLMGDKPIVPKSNVADNFNGLKQHAINLEKDVASLKQSFEETNSLLREVVSMKNNPGGQQDESAGFRI